MLWSVDDDDDDDDDDGSSLIDYTLTHIAL